MRQAVRSVLVFIAVVTGCVLVKSGFVAYESWRDARLYLRANRRRKAALIFLVWAALVAVMTAGQEAEPLTPEHALRMLIAISCATLFGFMAGRGAVR
jgi:hypothetical protein